MSTFSDYFSQSAALYAAFRPRYPDALFEWLASETPGLDRAWDCGTGSGQAAGALATRFNTVIATDPSVAQLANAVQGDGVCYVAATAEDSPLPARSVQLVTVAQALHWFDRARFYAEAERVLVPGGVVAAWSYGLISIDTPIDIELRRFHGETLGAWWPTERSIVDAGYGMLAFPFTELTPPPLRMEARWTRAHLEGYLNSWSAVTRYLRATGRSPVPSLMRTIDGLWGSASQERLVTWPLQMRAGFSRS